MTTSTRPSANAALATRNGDLWILVPPGDDGEVLVVNTTGYEIFRQCNGSRTPSDIAVELAGWSGAPTDEIAEDVAAFLARLQSAGMLAN
ncbi:PqqD family protein [Nocardia sp. NBC_00416]|uniref:PqqD family protein n=1 Tax=Nocardia sp. NBC_00416 TaxID=2975991 RepID=UPI002E1C9875